MVVVVVVVVVVVIVVVVVVMRMMAVAVLAAMRCGGDYSDGCGGGVGWLHAIGPFVTCS